MRCFAFTESTTVAVLSSRTGLCGSAERCALVALVGDHLNKLCICCNMGTWEGCVVGLWLDVSGFAVVILS